MELKYIIFAISAGIVGYLSGGINGAMILSRLVYKKDIRCLGSGNPGFTNFVRVYGLSITAIAVMLIDILKTALPVGLLSPILAGTCIADRQSAAAFIGICCMLGHAFPVWYGFKGGKTFISWAAGIWFINAGVAGISIAVFLIMLFGVKYMSLASMTAAFVFPILLAIFGGSIPAVLFSSLAALLLIWRHRPNIKRLISKTEPKFSFKNKM